MKLVECVPNFSEGRNMDVIHKITGAMDEVDSVTVLDVDPGADTNRTVVTLVGPPDAVIEAAFRGIRCASEVIDMRKHRGAHARMGACDVCPFVPVADVTMEECAEFARTLGKRVGQELGISVYLYENAASRPERRNLATVRAGEYEGMAEKLKDPKWAPDFGPTTLHEKAGVTAIGAREFLIAYNVNLNTQSKKIAHEIALDIREQGRRERDENGKVVRDEDGNIVMQAGRLKHCKAVGWYIDEYGLAQVSINLTNYHVTPPHLAFETVRELARNYGVRVTGSELVGLTPKEALLMAGRYYLAQQHRSPGIPEDDLLHIAIKSLGLDDLTPFDAKDKVIEYRIAEPFGPLASMTLTGFADETSRESPAPGGGSVSAYAGAMAASLAAMVANLTFGKPKYEKLFDTMCRVAQQGQELKDRLLRLIDEDTAAFNAVLEAMRLPKKSDEQKAQRAQAIEDANQHATEIPARVLAACVEVMPLAREMVRCGNPNSVSDAGVAAEMACAGAHGAAMNVLINLGGIQSEAFKTEKQNFAREKLEQADAALAEIRQQVMDKMSD